MKPPPKGPAGLLIEVGDDKSAPMKPGAEEAPSDMDAALDDAFDAVTRGDQQAFRDAMSAAISAKCAELFSADEADEGEV